MDYEITHIILQITSLENELCVLKQFWVHSKCEQKIQSSQTPHHTHTHTHTHQTQICFKDLAHVIVKTGRSETCRVGGSLENSGRVCVAVFPLETLRGSVPLSWKELSVFS